MLKILITIGGLFFLAVACNYQNPPAMENPTVNETPSPEQGESIYPISMQALMQKEFGGRDLVLGKVLEDNSAYTRYYITYKSLLAGQVDGELTISGIMNIPKGTAPEGGWPVLFLNHGHIDPLVYTNGRGLRREQDYLARQGFVVLHSDYRNHAESDKDDTNETVKIRLGYVEDVINAVLAVQNSNLKNINKQKIGMLGHSMGGGITQSVLVVKPDLVKAAVLYAPVSGRAGDSFERWTKTRAPITKQIEEQYGSPTTSPEFWANISSETFFNNIKTPMLYFHGTGDDSVPIEWSRRSVEILKNLNKTADLIEYPGQPHEFAPPTWNDFMKKSAVFFKQYLN